MRTITDIRIQELYVHVLDNRIQPFTLVLTDFPIQLDGNPPVSEYFCNHILSSLHDLNAKAANFQNFNPNQASGICRDILAGTIDLLSGSKVLAEFLFDILKNDTRIDPCNLGISICQDLHIPENRFLTILKIDPSEVFQHEIISENGKKRISYRINRDVITKEKLQKCAFIRPLDPRPEDYDMLLLDTQTRRVDKRVAKFFAESFLDARETNDATSRTRKLYNILKGVHNEFRDQLHDDTNLELDQRILLSVKGRTINTEQWVEELPVSEPIREQFRRALQSKLPDVVFDIDQKVAQNMTRKITFLGDHDLRMSFLAENYRDIIQSEKIFTDPDGRQLRRIEIVTQTWKKI